MAIYPYFVALLIVFVMVHGAAGQCQATQTDNCTYTLRCHGVIRGFQFPSECQGSTNFLTSLRIILNDAIDFGNDEQLIDPDLLGNVVSFTVLTPMPKSNLVLLEYMPKLEYLSLVNISIEHIDSPLFYKLYRLADVDLSRNMLSDVNQLFKFEKSFNSMTKLNLAFNSIEKLATDVFEELSFLIELDLSNNSLTHISENHFNNLTSLEILRLSHNKIISLNGAINKLFNLRHFYFNGNQIQDIDADTDRIIHLETFDMSDNNVETIHPTIFTRHWLHFDGDTIKIRLSNNQIVLVPNGIQIQFGKLMNVRNRRQMSNLHTELNLSNNIISTIERDAFKTVMKLKHLDVSKNKLQDFIVDPYDLKDVTYLNLSSNFIMKLYFSVFFSMKNLHNLDLSNNQLDFLSDGVFTKNYNLQHVNMTFNRFRTLEKLHIKMFHPDGGALDLSNNGLSRLRIKREEALTLYILNLDNNNITDITLIDLGDRKDLKTLTVSNNFIEHLDQNSLRLPNCLSYLDLSHNDIQRIDASAFHKLNKLQTLRLSNNMLFEVNFGMFQGLISLKYLDLSFNDIRHLDSKTMIDLRALQILSIRYNEMFYLDYKDWFAHDYEIEVTLDGNNYTCEWLANALRDYENGYSKMKPTVHDKSLGIGVHSLEGIPCISDDDITQKQMLQEKSDDRLLSVAKKILKAVETQNSYLRKVLPFASLSPIPMVNMMAHRV